MERMPLKSFARSAAIVAVSVAVIFGVFRLTIAGSLTPPSAPAGTLDSVASLSNALFGTFDSTGVTASANGDLLQVTKCIINRIHGSTCP